ncbi:DMT family transporter [Streptomyces marispadix]|uniref:DMT family transporter n=1 Tax=Streptomyces marispadix TaxID=2922868 RepID=A0ABS9SWV0_9ACTN|nr:DMT family transporter [Streptomyces marispadix]MCH6160735.1 DMT family transporter [Streptomyces marispadix]
MTPLVVAAVLVAAVTHASWNALAHHIKDQLLAFTLVGVGGALCGLVLACFVPLPASGAWPALLVSALLHVVYQVLLMRSFGLGDFGQMYPIARGTAPLVVTVLAALFLQELPDAWQLTGVAVASAGLLGVALWGIRRRGHGTGDGPAGPIEHPVPTGQDASGPAPAPSSRRPALIAAVATGLAIASYTVVDGAGVRAAGSAPGYVAWLMMLQSFVIPAYAIATRRGALLAQLRPLAVRGVIAGALSIAAYGLVLWAQTRAPLAPVAALRESSIIAGAAIGALFFKERFGAPRVAASALMVGGIALMLHGG